MKGLKLGIDDAGRGPVIGPMVIAGCLVDEKTEKEFRRLGVRDSKQLTPKRRAFLEKTIKEKSETFEIQIANPKDIDSKGEKGINLNQVEAIMCAKIINKINNRDGKIKIVIDCPSTNRTTWKDFVMTKVKDLSNLEISCEHKADKNHVSVSAASILAKQARERKMGLLKKKYGKDMGSGYPSDPITKKFLGKNIKKHDKAGIFRKSWKTWKSAASKSKQKKLEF